MALSKLGSRGITDGSILAADFAPGSVPADKLAGSIENSKLSNSTITIGGQAISLGGTDNSLNLVDWQSKITSDGSTVTTMVSGRGYFIDNSSAAGIVKLPASASIGDFVAIKDYAGNFGTNNLTIQRNSHNIQGVAADSSISTNRASVVLVYVDATKGWLYTDEHNVAALNTPFVEATGGTVTTTGDFKVHTFTGDGCFVVSNTGLPSGSTTVDYLVVAGGGGGRNGGGGAGGFRQSFPNPATGGFPISVQTYPITVGGGGAAGPAGNPLGCVSSGSNSVFSTITSHGGGYGGGAGGPSNGDAADGGSGGGQGAPPGNPAGSGNTPPVSPPQGNNGGNGAGPAPGGGGGGGGGHNAAGGNANSATNGNGGAGGNGTASTITGSSVTRAGGGGGASYTSNNPATPPYPAPTGGSGGGGAGGQGTTFGTPAYSFPAANGTPGSANTGGGAGGGGVGFGNVGGSGGSGIVIIRYKYQ